MTAVRTAIEMKVVGVLAIGTGEDRRSSAIISMGKSKSGSQTYSPGQKIAGDPDLMLVRVRNERIEFMNKGRLEFAPVKQFPEAGWGGGGGSSSSSYSASNSSGGAASSREDRLQALRDRRASRATQRNSIVPGGDHAEDGGDAPEPEETPESEPQD